MKRSIRHKQGMWADMEIVTASTSTTPGSAMKLESIARNFDNHATWIAVLGSVALHVATVVAMRFANSGPAYVEPPPPKPVKVRILANPNGNPAAKQVKAVEIAQPKPKPKPNNRNISKTKDAPKEEPQPEVASNDLPQSFGDDPTGGVVGVGVSTTSGDSDPGVTTNWQPIEQVKPDMPQEAALKGIEGFIKFRLDINEEGKPENISVIEAENRSIFEAAARKALRKWKYAPRMVNGQAVRVVGHVVEIRFNLTD